MKTLAQLAGTESVGNYNIQDELEVAHLELGLEKLVYSVEQDLNSVGNSSKLFNSIRSLPKIDTTDPVQKTVADIFIGLDKETIGMGIERNDFGTEALGNTEKLIEMLKNAYKFVRIKIFKIVAKLINFVTIRTKKLRELEKRMKSIVFLDKKEDEIRFTDTEIDSIDDLGKFPYYLRQSTPYGSLIHMRSEFNRIIHDVNDFVDKVSHSAPGKYSGDTSYLTMTFRMEIDTANLIYLIPGVSKVMLIYKTFNDDVLEVKYLSYNDYIDTNKNNWFSEPNELYTGDLLIRAERFNKGYSEEIDQIFKSMDDVNIRVVNAMETNDYDIININKAIQNVYPRICLFAALETNNGIKWMLNAAEVMVSKKETEIKPKKDDKKKSK